MRARAPAVLAFDPDNSDARDYLEAAERGQASACVGAAVSAESGPPLPASFAGFEASPEEPPFELLQIGQAPIWLAWLTTTLTTTLTDEGVPQRTSADLGLYART